MRDRSAGALVAFAQSGDPNVDGLDWPVYAPDNERLVEFDIDPVDTIEWPNHQAMQIVHEQHISQ